MTGWPSRSFLYFFYISIIYYVLYIYCKSFGNKIKNRFLDELVHEKEKFKAISDELDQTFAEMSGY